MATILVIPLGWMGGTITVDSEPGLASTFTFTIRLALEPRRPDGAKSQVVGDEPGVRGSEQTPPSTPTPSTSTSPNRTRLQPRRGCASW